MQLPCHPLLGGTHPASSSLALRLATRTLCPTSVGLAVTMWCQWAENTSRKGLWVPLEQAEIQLSWGKLRSLVMPAAPCLVLFEPYWAPNKHGISYDSCRLAGEPWGSRGRSGRKGWMLAGRTDSPPKFPQLSAQSCTVVSTGSAKWRLPAQPGVLTPDRACSLPGSPEKLGQTGPKELSHPPPHLIPTVFCPRHS